MPRTNCSPPAVASADVMRSCWRPLSLVQAITSTTSLFVFIFGIGVSIFFPALGREDLSSRELLKKGLGGVLTGIGVILIVW